MIQMDIIDLFSRNKTIQEWHSHVSLKSRQLVTGLSGSSKAVAIASAYRSQGKKIVVVTASQHEAEQLSANLIDLVGEDKVYSFFTDDILAAEFIFSSLDKAASRLAALDFLRDDSQSGILVVSLMGLRVLLPSPEVYDRSRYTFKVGVEMDLEDRKSVV